MLPTSHHFLQIKASRGLLEAFFSKIWPKIAKKTPSSFQASQRKTEADIKASNIYFQIAQLNPSPLVSTTKGFIPTRNGEEGALGHRTLHFGTKIGHFWPLRGPLGPIYGSCRPQKTHLTIYFGFRSQKTLYLGFVIQKTLNKSRNLGPNGIIFSKNGISGSISTLEGPKIINLKLGGCLENGSESLKYAKIASFFGSIPIWPYYFHDRILKTPQNYRIVPKNPASFAIYTQNHGPLLWCHNPK